MRDISTPFFTSVTSGFVFTKDKIVLIIRAIVYTMLICLFLIPYKLKLDLKQQAFFSLGISGFVLIVKLFLYLLNKLVDKSIEISSSSGEANAESQENRPANIPGPLWDRRFEYINGRSITENDVYELISSGFNSDDVFEFYRVLNSGDYNNEQPTLEQSQLPDSHNYLNIYGHLVYLPFQRKAINSIFPGNVSILYVIIATIVSFIMSFVASNSKSYAIWAFGPSIYSLLHPPEVEPYSTTRGDIYTGISRPFYVSIILSIEIILRYLAEHQIVSNISYLDVTIDWVCIYEIARPNLLYMIYFLPIIILFLIGHPIGIITWFFEWLSRYMFGLGGSTGILHSLLQFLRSAFVSIIIHILYNVTKDHDYSLPICFFIASLLLQIPLSFTIQLKKEILRFIISLFVLSLLSMLGSFIGIKGKMTPILISCFSLCFLFDVVWPYIVSNNQYLIFHFRIMPKTSKVMNILRLLTPSFFAPMILSSVVKNDDPPSLLLSIVIVCTVNRSFIEPQIFAFSVLCYIMFQNFEYTNVPSTFLFYCSLCIVRKIFSITPIVRFFRHCRPYFYDVPSFDTYDVVIQFIITFVYTHVPFIDHTIETPALFWSLITGSPFNSPNLVFLYFFPLPPRPNSFWEINNGQSLDPKITFGTHLTEHPIETPVYNSTARALSLALSSMLKSGRLGLVDSNDVFLFINDTMSAFVHVVAQEPHCTRFQLRGLEYQLETSCHRGELNYLRKIIDEYQISLNFEIALTFYSTIYSIRALDVPLRIYSASNVDIANVFIGNNMENIIDWIAISFAFIVSKNKSFISDNLPDELVTSIIADFPDFSTPSEPITETTDTNIESSTKKKGKKNKDKNRNRYHGSHLENGNGNNSLYANLIDTNNSESIDTMRVSDQDLNLHIENPDQSNDNNNNNNNNNNGSINNNENNNNDNHNIELNSNLNEINPQIKNIFFEKLRFFGGSLGSDSINSKAFIIFNYFKDAVYTSQTGQLNFDNILNLFNEDALINAPFLLQEIEMSHIVYPAARFTVLILELVASQIAPEITDMADVVDFIIETYDKYAVTPITSEEFSKEFEEEKRSILSMIRKEDRINLINFNLTLNNWNVFQIQREAVRSFWASEANSQLFLSINASERNSIQMDEQFLHNLIVQSCNIPLGYPALVSPILSSFSVPPSLQMY